MPTTKNINVDLFKRYSPKNKLEMIENFSQDQLLSITCKTVLRMIKEAGVGDSRKTRSKFKTLYLKGAGNDWNSRVTSVENCKKDEILLCVYIQGEDIDTDDYYELKEFLNNRYETQCLGKIHESFKNGYSHDLPANYDRADRARVIKAICLAYVNNKYASKLKTA